MHHQEGEADHKKVVEKILAKTSRDWFGDRAPHDHPAFGDEGQQGD